MPSTTIKVSVELRDRIAALAQRDNTTLAAAIARALDSAESAAFWADVTMTMSAPEPTPPVASEVEQFSRSLTDGLDPNETWDNVW